ncbi:MAG: hypothetical protein N4A33_11760 [Bacteriovoracaceae bacterium]|jgi:hypothetical protein|nr:hypothetical protein [Bacteriovoracaceae bacterium]
MKTILFLIGLLTFTSFANEMNSTKGNMENLEDIFLNGSAMKFTTNLDKALIVECNASYGLIGLSDKNYAAYNRITPAIVISSEVCESVLTDITKNEKTLTFSWIKTDSCNFFGCKYKSNFKIK